MKRTAAFVLIALGAAGAAYAFGVEPGENGLGSEHERITRAAIGDMAPATLDALAGRDDDPGAVGAPDIGAWSALAAAHCEGGDFLQPAQGDRPYAQTLEAARDALIACRTFMIEQLERAVAAAKPLSDPAPGDTALDCGEDGATKSAKCVVLAHLGAAFHTAQDFYAHTNWVDHPAAGPTDAKNPPGLARKGRAWWIDPRATKIPFPAGLISSCWPAGDTLGLTTGCNYGDWSPLFGADRVRRADLGKGLGPIGAGIGGTGVTPRGAIGANFRNAVALAVEETRDKWAYFQERVREAYPGAPGEMILCAVASDAFDKSKCSARAATGMLCAARRAVYVDETASTLSPLFAPREEENAEAEALWEPLRAYCRLEEALLARDAVMNGGTGERGRALAKEKAVEALALWNACPVEAKRRLDLLAVENVGVLREMDEEGANRSRIRASLGRMYADCIVAARLRQLGK